MKRLFFMIAVGALTSSVLFTSCTKEKEVIKEVPVTDPNVVQVTGNITSSTTWEDGKEYILTTRVAVESGATLTIQPGVIVKGESGSGANACALIIARGAKIMAEGTAAKPIIFTSIADEIKPGFTSPDSPNMDPSVDGLWGGIIVLGNAPISPKSGEETAQIEGIPNDDSNGKYGGTIADDNSGVIKYVSIRHGGTNIGEGNEINGLTLGGVGNGTMIENIEVVANQDDGIEFFGGTVNVTNAVVWNNGDDAIDTDQAWAGTLDNFMVINPGDKAFELDGPEGSYTSTGHTIQNGTVYMKGCAGGYDDDSNTDAKVSNIFFTKITHKTGKSNDYNVNGSFVATNLQFDVTAVDLDDDEDTPNTAPVALDYFGDMDNTIISEVTTGTVGADKSKLSWTWASSVF